MQDALTTYFDGEKYAGLLLAGVAIAAIGAAVAVFRAGSGLRSFALTLAIFAIAEIALGVGLYLRTGAQVEGLLEQRRVDAPAFHAAESARMGRVQKNFVIVEYVELAVIIVTGVVAVALKGRPGVSGVALGLLINGALLLAFDLIAERRGEAYRRFVNEQRN